VFMKLIMCDTAYRWEDTCLQMSSRVTAHEIMRGPGFRAFALTSTPQKGFCAQKALFSLRYTLQSHINLPTFSAPIIVSITMATFRSKKISFVFDYVVYEATINNHMSEVDTYLALRAQVNSVLQAKGETPSRSRIPARTTSRSSSSTTSSRRVRSTTQ
jgi:hypothetical protein